MMMLLFVWNCGQKISQLQRPTLMEIGRQFNLLRDVLYLQDHRLRSSLLLEMKTMWYSNYQNKYINNKITLNNVINLTSHILLFTVMELCPI